MTSPAASRVCPPPDTAAGPPAQSAIRGTPIGVVAVSKRPGTPSESERQVGPRLRIERPPHDGGRAPTATSGIVSLADTRHADESEQQSTIGGFPILQPLQSFRVNMPFAVSTFYDEQHDLTFVVDSSDNIMESDEADNTRIVPYVLQQGPCPQRRASSEIAVGSATVTNTDPQELADNLGKLNAYRTVQAKQARRLFPSRRGAGPCREHVPNMFPRKLAIARNP